MNSTSLTPKREQEIRTRRQGITDAPWGSSRDLDGECTVEAGAYITLAEGFTSSGDVAHIVASTDERGHRRADFIARAPSDIDTLLAELDRLRKENRELDRSLSEVITERDRMHDVADELAYAVAPIEVIGEHSSGNDPWQNALDIVTPETEVDRLRALVTELKNAALCPSTAQHASCRCVLPIRHPGDHRNAAKNHYWDDEHAAPLAW